jgi:glutaredoxin 3
MAVGVDGHGVSHGDGDGLTTSNPTISFLQLTLYSKSFCPYCDKTKALFAELGVEAQIYELNEMDDGPAIQDALLTLTGQRTVPNIFINQQHVGGNDNVQAAHRSGKLKQMLGL